MSVQVLLDTTIDVHYGFLDLRSDALELHWEAGEETRGQLNGLCGAAVPGMLHLQTGLNTGPVHVTIELHTTEPSLDNLWEEAVEVAFATTATDLVLQTFDHQEGPVDLPPGTYRARYCARGMQEGRDQGTLVGGEPVDHYLLQFWPSSGPDRVLRQTTDVAAYWHRDGTKPALSADDLTDRMMQLRAARRS
jgi:hypothetical protein